MLTVCIPVCLPALHQLPQQTDALLSPRSIDQVWENSDKWTGDYSPLVRARLQQSIPDSGSRDVCEG